VHLFKNGISAKWLIAAAVLLSTIGSVAASRGREQKPLGNAVILVIRHAEKPDEGDWLTPAGVARANAYPTYFAHLKIDGKRFHIDHIFAAADSRKSRRPRLTVEPLGRALNMPIDHRFKNGDYQDLVNDLESHPYGKDIVVCWHHGKIPELIEALGAPASLFPTGKWPDDIFDQVIELKFDADGKLIPSQAKILHEHLMPGDRA
jgi:hypothetical protein